MRRLTLALVLLTTIAGQAWAQQRTGVAVRSIAIAARGGETVVMITGTDALPVPTLGVLDDPPRIFIDMVGVRPATPAVIRSTDPRIRRIRVALNSAAPLVTRIVIDLSEPQPHRVDREGRDVRVVLGAAIAPVPDMPANPVMPTAPPPAPAVAQPAAAPASTPNATIEPVPPLPDPPRAAAPAPPATRAPADTPDAATPERSRNTKSRSRANPPPASPQDLEKYRRLVLPLLDRFRQQQSVLTALDANEDQRAERLHSAMNELALVRQELLPLKAPESVRAQHDMLMQALTLGMMAARLRLDAYQTNDPNTIRNAASAAAGAILLLDRLCSDLSCPEPGR